jgi:hypothetical protein
VAWVDGEEENDAPLAWGLTPAAAHVSLGAGVFAAWRAHVAHDTLPRAGGWADQPLAMLATFNALDLVEATWRFYRMKDADLRKLTRLQLAVIKWLEEDNDG